MAEIAILEGTVVHGQHLGRKLGYPTANLDLVGLKGLVPGTGVYAAYCTLPDGRILLSMVNVGFRPTVDKLTHKLSIEAHLLDFQEDLYGKVLKLNLFERIRDERKMDTLEQLKEQLADDLKSVRICGS